MNRFNGELLWETEMADWHQNYNGTSAPLTVGNLVISGTAGGDEGVRGFVAAYDQHDRQRSLALLDRPQTRRARIRKHGRERNIDHRSGATWMTGTYDPQLDTGLLAHRQSRPRLRWRRAPGRQSLHRFHARAGSQDRQAQVVLPVHAARRARLGRAGAARAGRHQLARPAAQAAAASQSQRILLCVRPHQRPAAAGQTRS